jgi:arginine/ornithine N-succinyltransferase beta subunit
MVDIFDACACVSCRRDDIRTVRRSRTAVVAGIVDGGIDSPTSMIGSFSPAFRATIGPVKILDADSVCIESRAASVLGVSVGSSVRHAVLRAEPESPARRAVSVRGSSYDLDHESD